ncbi:MAG: GyrI-like domain-containing protein [Defluviitaleaceae bacterium]|nr:GyrI-like domain-containing protein [Defluviitaleaceae bacterium]
MPEIIKTYRQTMTPSKFIGKRYTDEDRVNGGFGEKWGEWFQNGWFDQLEKQVSGNMKNICEDGDGNIGLMREIDGIFEYWIGYFMPESTTTPEGFQSMDFPKSELGVCWVYGKEEEVFMQEGHCGERLEGEGFKVLDTWCFERYTCPRFTTPDEKGNIILDVCFFVE